MAYGLNYTLTQELRDDTIQVVKIYKKDYSGSVKTYEPTSVILQPNSNEEDPIGGIISSQLNVSFIISTEDDYIKFPDLLNFDDTLYYVELVINNLIKWKGFLFNDYIDVAFTTGNQEVNIVCVDGLSLIKYNNYDTNNSINTVVPLINLIGTCLSNIPYNTASNLFACCSYYAEGMLDRGDGGQYEPFAQSSIYIRDVINVDYYTILDNIVKTFGCRLFQSNGDWYILPINSMASTVYFTKYTITSTPAVVSSGTLNNLINIQPYQEGNIHFIDNNQTKIVRKGYQVVESNSNYDYSQNAINNGSFKKIASGEAIGWEKTETSTGTVDLVIVDEAEFNYYDIKNGSSFFGVATLTNVVTGLPKQTYAPQMFGPGATLSFEYEAFQVGDKIRLVVELYKKGTVSYTSYYLTNDFKWSPTIVSIDVIAEREEQFEKKTINIPLGQVVTTGPLLEVGYFGHIIIKFIADSADYNGGKIRNIKITQTPNQLTALDIKRQIGQNNVIVKTIDIPYGLYHPPFTSWNGGNNNTGALFNLTLTGFFNGSLINWYRYGFAAEEFYQLHSLIIRQYSNLLNKNIATLEGDLGNYQSTNGLVYLDKTYTVQDSSTNALSYNGKKFLINRLTLDTYNSQVNSIQLIEVINTDNAAVETLKYIGL
jgi:hypothetical protein